MVDHRGRETILRPRAVPFRALISSPIAAAISGEGLAVSAWASVASFKRSGIATTEASEVSLAIATALATMVAYGLWAALQLVRQRRTVPEPMPAE